MPLRSIEAGGLFVGSPRGEVDFQLELPGGAVSSSRFEMQVRCPNGPVKGDVTLYIGGMPVGFAQLGPGDNRVSFPVGLIDGRGGPLSIRLFFNLSGGRWDDPPGEFGVRLLKGELVLEGSFVRPKGVYQWLSSLTDGAVVVVPNEPRPAELSAAFCLVSLLDRYIPNGRVVLIKSSEEAMETLPKVMVQLDDQQAEGVTVDAGGGAILINGVSASSLKDVCEKIFDPILQGMLQGTTVTKISGGAKKEEGLRWGYRRSSRCWSHRWGAEIGDLFLWGGPIGEVELKVSGAAPLLPKEQGVLDLYVNGELADSSPLGSGKFEGVRLKIPDWIKLGVRDELRFVVRGAGGGPSIKVTEVSLAKGKLAGPRGLWDISSGLGDGVPVLVDQDLKWSGVLGSLEVFRWLCSPLPRGLAVFPDLRFYRGSFDAPGEFFVCVGSRLPLSMTDRLNLLYNDGQFKLTSGSAQARISDEAFWVMGQTLKGKGGLSLLVPSRVEKLPEAVNALPKNGGSPIKGLGGQVFFYGSGGLQVVDLSPKAPSDGAWGMFKLIGNLLDMPLRWGGWYVWVAGALGLMALILLWRVWGGSPRGRRRRRRSV